MHDLFSIVSLFQPLHSTSFSILLFLEDSSCDLLEENVLFCPIRCIASPFLSENGQIFDSSDKVPSFENEAVAWILEELCLHIRLNSCWSSSDRASDMIFLFLKKHSQIILIEPLVLLEQLDQLAFQRNCGYLDDQKEFFLFLNETLARRSSLDLSFSSFETSPRVSPCQYESAKKTSQNFLYWSDKF